MPHIDAFVSSYSYEVSKWKTSKAEFIQGER